MNIDEIIARLQMGDRNLEAMKESIESLQEEIRHTIQDAKKWFADHQHELPQYGGEDNESETS